MSDGYCVLKIIKNARLWYTNKIDFLRYVGKSTLSQLSNKGVN